MDSYRTPQTCAWLEAVQEVQTLKERERKRKLEHKQELASIRQALIAAKKRRGELFAHVYEEERAEQDALHHDPQDLDSDNDAWDPRLLDVSEVDECWPQPEANIEAEPQLGSPSQLELSELELSGHAPAPVSGPGLETALTRLSKNKFTDQQKDVMRALICENLDRRPGTEEVESVAKAAGLTVQQARGWLHDFYSKNPSPTHEQAMAWRRIRTDSLHKWLEAHRDNPYPSREEKQRLAREAGLTFRQVERYFDRARRANGLTSKPAFSPFSPDQIATLCASFEKKIHPSAEEKQRLAGETGLAFKQVDRWFNNARHRQ